MEYNTTRTKLNLAEYGRHIQIMVNYALTIEDREKRCKVAKEIVTIMGQLNPQFKEYSDYKHKLWDHLFLISDFKLDVDSPYPIPPASVLTSKPDKVSYPYRNIPFRHYGHNIEMIIQKATTYEDGPEKDALIKTIANHLKKSYLNWNREAVDDDVISDHLSILSDGKLKLNANDTLHRTQDILARNNNNNKRKRIQLQNNPSNNNNNNRNNRNNKLNDNNKKNYNGYN